MNTQFLNGTRFFLALWVVLGHFYTTVGGTGFIQIPFVSMALNSPSVAVDLFIVITGFLMTYHYIKREDVEPFNESRTGIKFITRRFFRIYPVYFLAVIISYLTINQESRYLNAARSYFAGSNETPILHDVSIASLLTHLTFLHGFVPSHLDGFLGQSWSLSLEMQFYILFPILFYFIFAKNDGKGVFAFSIFSAFGAIVFSNVFGLSHLSPGMVTHFSQPSILLYKLPLFSLGMVIACVGLNKLKWEHLLIVFVVIIPFQSYLTTVLLAGMTFMFFLDHFKAYMNNSLYAALDSARGFLGGKVFTIGADISYSLYLIHMITLTLTVKVTLPLVGELSKYQAAGIMLVVFLASSFLFSYALFQTVEKPFIKIGKNFVNRKFVDKIQVSEQKAI